MTLDVIYMPLPAGASGRLEAPLGPWEEPKPPSLSPAQRKAAYRAGKRDEINRRQRELRAQRKAA